MSKSSSSIWQITICLLSIFLMVGCSQIPQTNQSSTIDHAIEEDNSLEAPQEKASSITTETNPITSFTQNDTGTPNLSFDALNPIQPVDVLNEISYVIVPTYLHSIDDYENFGHLYVEEGTSTSFSWMHPIHATTCGWQSEEKIQVTLELPDGSTITDTIVAASKRSGPFLGTANMDIMDIIDKLDAGGSVPTTVSSRFLEIGKFLSSNAVVFDILKSRQWSAK